jgi:hypothetical protein
MGQILSFLRPNQWILERSTWRPDPITLRDEAGMVIPSTSLTTMVLTLYDLTGGANAIVNLVNATDIKNVGRGNITTQGVFTLTLLPADTVILTATNEKEVRRALIEYTYASGAKADAIEMTFIIRNLALRT